MIRRRVAVSSVFAAWCLLIASTALAQKDDKFRTSGTALGANDRYRVVLTLDLDDDPELIARQLAGTYGVQVADRASAAEVEVLASEAEARLLSGDRRVALVERAAETNARRPSKVTTHAPGGFGAYEYDGAGNVTTLGSDTFVYDAFGRIHTATVSGPTQNFTYDRHGNITNINTTGPSGTSARPIAVGTGNRLSGATYDGSGNLLSYHGGTFAYDGLNMVTDWTPAGGGNRRVYIYTADNERIATIELLPDGKRRTDWTIRDTAGKVLRRYRTHPNGAWSWEEDYIYRGSQLLAAEVPSPEKVRHFHLDHLGTPRLITGNGGAKLAERAYGAFGEGFTVTATPQVMPAPNEAVQFTGHERDNFQLDYMHARYYDPLIGRFLTCDPVFDFDAALSHPQLWNRYTYALNNPIRFIDPTGEIVALARLTEAERAQLLLDLNRFTGNEYAVNAQHELTLVSEGPDASSTATEFIAAAMEATTVYDVTARNGSSVVFAEVNTSTNVITFDFKDFSAVNYNGVDSRTFGPGSTLVHELAHVHPQPDGRTLGDGPLSLRASQPGPTETFVNKIRTERGLPHRGPAYEGKRAGFWGRNVLVNFQVGRRIVYVSAREYH